MRIFTCCTTADGAEAPTLVMVFAADERRARELARRALSDAKLPAKVEVYEDGKLLFTEHATGELGPERAGARRVAQTPRTGAIRPSMAATNHRADCKPDELNGFINGQKIWRYGENLADGADAEQRELLRALLVREENRFGAYSEKLETAQGFLSKLGERIEAQHRRIARLRELGCDTALADQVLQQFERTSELFVAFAERVQRELMTVSL